MNLFNIKPIKKIASILLSKGKIKWIPYVYKYLPKNWTDINESNLYHFAAKHQNEYLFEMAKLNEANINGIDKYGNAPIHKFIEASFVINDNIYKKINKNKESKENIIFECDDVLLNKFIDVGADVNQWIVNMEKNGQWGKNVATFHRDNIMGSPIELLIKLFWKNIVDSPTFDDEEALKKYEEIYFILSKAGAKINMIVDAGSFFNWENEKIKDAMQISHSVIISHFFTKYIMKTNDLNIIAPILKDPKVDFSLVNDEKNTLLHHLFGRISSKYNRIPMEKIHKTLNLVLENPSFKEEDLYIENSFRLAAIKCFKKEANEYKVYIDKYLLAKKLEKELKNNVEKKITRNKL